MNDSEVDSTSQEKSTLSTGKYTIEFGGGPSVIYKFDEDNNKIWLASVSDPETAMQIIEGLILVEHKRFYHPEATPTINVKDGNPAPPFLKRS
jgi:hypothetical protein